MMIYIAVLLLASLMVSTWSYQRGTGFWFGFGWSFLLSPLLGAILVLLRRPRPRIVVRAGVAVGEDDPAAPRPLFCLMMIIALTLVVLIWANAEAIRMNIALFLLEM